MKNFIRNLPIVGQLALAVHRRLIGRRKKPEAFPGSEAYWEGRYASGRDSGVGSYDKFAEFKAQVLNDFVARHGVASVIEFGCGDGHQLSLATYPRYLGLDVSRTAVDTCRKRFPSDSGKSFKLMQDYDGETGELALSLDVLFHLVENEVFENYMRTLFEAGERYVVIYSSNSELPVGDHAPHVRHRTFTTWIERNLSGWVLEDQVANPFPYEGDYRTGSFADFFVYARA